MRRVTVACLAFVLCGAFDMGAGIFRQQVALNPDIEQGIKTTPVSVAGLTLNAAARLFFANAKFNSYYIRPGTAGAINSFVLEAGATYAFRGGFYVRPHFEYNSILDSAVRAAVGISDWVSLRKPDLFNFGMAIGFSFE